MYDFLDFLGVCIVVILLSIGAVGGITYALNYTLIRPSCYAHWANSGMQVQWSFFGDCQLKQIDGTWITDDAYLALNKNVSVK